MGSRNESSRKSSSSNKSLSLSSTEVSNFALIGKRGLIGSELVQPNLHINFPSRVTLFPFKEGNNHHLGLTVTNGKIFGSKNSNSFSGKLAFLPKLLGKLGRISSTQSALIIAHVFRRKDGDIPSISAGSKKTRISRIRAVFPLGRRDSINLSSRSLRRGARSRLAATSSLSSPSFTVTS